MLHKKNTFFMLSRLLRTKNRYIYIREGYGEIVFPIPPDGHIPLTSGDFSGLRNCVVSGRR